MKKMAQSPEPGRAEDDLEWFCRVDGGLWVGTRGLGSGMYIIEVNRAVRSCRSARSFEYSATEANLWKPQIPSAKHLPMSIMSMKHRPSCSNRAPGVPPEPANAEPWCITPPITGKFDIPSFKNQALTFNRVQGSLLLWILSLLSLPDVAPCMDHGHRLVPNSGGEGFFSGRACSINTLPCLLPGPACFYIPWAPL